MTQGPESTAPAALVPPDGDRSLQVIFDCLLNEYGIDFSRYKPATMSRRIWRRLGILGLQHLGDYVQALHASPQERHALARDLLVRVTHFFRDAEAFELLEREVIPALLQSVSERQTIRVWVSACSTGEEAYSIAILLREALDRVPSRAQVRIFATDVDRQALDVAAQGVYPEQIAEALTPQRLERFFGKEQNRYRVRRHLREMVHFIPHNLMQDPPFTNISLVSCRNCLIYLRTEVQQHILACFADALRQPGYLLLGPSESCSPLSSAFRTVHAKWKIYQKVSAVTLPGSAAPLPSAQSQLRLSEEGRSLDPLPWQAYARLAEWYGPPALILDKHGDIMWMLGEAHVFLQALSGVPSRHILQRVREELNLPVATALRRMLQHEQEFVSEPIPIRVNHAMRPIRLRIQWVEEGLLRKAQPNILVCFEYLEARPRLPVGERAFDSEVDAPPRIENLQQELSDTKANLQKMMTEIESTKQQLHAMTHELVVTKERLQSTKEDLCSVNEELYAINSAYKSKTKDLIQLNDDMENLSDGTKVGAIFLDTDLKLRKFTHSITSVLSVTPQDLGCSIQQMKLPFIDFPVWQAIDNVLKGRQSLEKEVRSDQGNWFLLRLLPVLSDAGVCQGVMLSFIDITPLKAAEAVLQDERRLWQSILHTLRLRIAVLDRFGLIFYVNEAWLNWVNARRYETISYTGLRYIDVYPDIFGVDDRVAEQASQGLCDVLTGVRSAFAMAYSCPSTKRECLMRVIGLETHQPARMMVMHEDITDVAGERG